MNTIDISDKLQLYFIQRDLEKKQSSDFLFTYEKKVLVKKRKPTSHFDLILEEYFNLRRLNFQAVKENKDKLKH